MNTNTILSICLFSILIFTNCVSMQSIEGDGKIITKNIDIPDFETIKVKGGEIEINYTQSSDKPRLTITTDQNIFDIYTFEVKNNTLTIEPKKTYQKTYRIKPTQFSINTNSTTVSQLSLSGRVDMTVIGPLISPKDLEINMGGSVKVNIPERIEANNIQTNIGGSGTLTASDINCSRYKGEVAGSGTLILGGKTQEVEFSIAGSGKVKAFDLQTVEMAGSIAGSGNIEISVSDKMDIDIAGSGKIRYKGDPQIKKSVAGSGSIKKVD